MKEIILIFYILLGLSDIMLFVDFRGLIFSFLLSKRNKKGAKEIHSSQSLFDRFTFNYIKEHTIYPKEYMFFHRFYFVFLIVLPIQYTALVITNIFSMKAVTVMLVLFILIKFACFIYLCLQRNSKRIYRFDKRYE